MSANIRLFDKTATAWTTQGLGVINPTEALVTEELNGMFEAELEVPITDRHYSDLSLQSIIIVKPNPYEAAEPFRVYQISRPIGGLVTVNAAHISYDLSKYADAPFTASSLAQIMARLKSSSVETCPFNFQTDKTISSLEYKVTSPKSIRSLLAGSEDAILEQFGGEWKFSGYTCYLYEHRGQDRGVVIRYGKNMTDIQQDENCANVYSKLYPFYMDSEGNLVEVSGRTIDINTNGNGVLVHDMSAGFDAPPTPAELEQAAQDYIAANNLSSPVVSLDVKFVQTDLSKDIIYLGDTLSVFFPRLGVSSKAKVVRTVYNAIVGRYEEIQVGDAQQTFAQTIASLQTNSTTGAVGQSVIQAAIDKIAAMITGQIGGNIQLRDANADGKIDALEVLDNINRSSASKVFRWSNDGAALGLDYTTGGVNGTYKHIIRGLASGVNAWLNDLYINGNTATPVGTVVTGTNTVTSIAASTFTNIAQITLTKGTWVISGQIRMYTGFNGTVIGGISTASGAVQAAEGGFAQLYTATALAQCGMSLSRIITVTSASQTIYLVGWQNSGASKNLTAGQSHLQAINIG